MAEQKDVVNILGREFAVKLPPQFAVCEELVMAYHEADAAGENGQRLRACGAILGVCCPDIGREASADYVKAAFRPLAYGGAVYGYLREHGAEAADVLRVARPILVALGRKVYPRAEEVKKQADFIEPVQGG